MLLSHGTYYFDEVLDDSNQAKGFSIYAVASGIGRITVLNELTIPIICRIIFFF